jgi:type VII secretion integral membrane protein EccD
MDNTLTGLCRINIRAPNRRVELAVPTDVPLGDLLPEIVRHAGPGMDEAGLAHQGWVLQRLGEGPLEEDGTLAAAGLHDGDTVYLRARADQLPPVHFDDLVDGIASTLRGRPDAWHASTTRYALLCAMAATLTAALAVIGLSMRGTPAVALSAGIAALLILAAGAASRAMDDRVAATLLGVASMPYIALAGVLVTTGTGPLLGARVLAGASAAAGTGVLALGVVGTRAEVFLALVGVCAVALVGAVAVVVLRASPVGAAGLVAVLVVFLTLFVPMLALRLAGLKIPPLPTNAEQLQEGIAPHPGADVVARARLTQAYVTAFLLAAGTVMVGCLTVLAMTPAWPNYALAGALSALCLLHSRQLASRWQRVASVLPGLYGALLLIVHLAVHAPTTVRMWILVGLFVFGAALLIGAWTLPGTRLVPYWGRLAELSHTLFALALVPLLCAVLGGYTWARTLF